MKSKSFIFLLLGLFLLTAATQGAPARKKKASGWERWLQNPPSVPVAVSLSSLNAESNTLVQVTLADGVGLGYGDTNGCATATNGPTFFANLNVRREYLLTVVATNLEQLELALEVRPPWQLLAKSGSGSTPKDYEIRIDRSPGTTISAATNCTYYSNAWIVEIRDNQGAQWLVDDQSNNPGPSAGEGAPLSMGPSKSQLTNRITLDWGVSLGRLFDGNAAGRLRLTESGLSRDAYTPKAIYYSAASTNTRAQVELINANADGSLRQVKAFQALVDIVDPWTFIGADFTNLATLANRLKTETNALGLYMSNRLTTVTWQAVTNYSGTAEPLKTLLLNDFNRLLAGVSLYESNRFYGVTLSAETQFLWTGNAQGADLLRLNRLLLEDAYATALARRTYQTALNFYTQDQVGTGTNSLGVYTNLTGAPYVSWYIQNPFPTAATNLVLLESRNNTNYTNVVTYAPQAQYGAWTLTRGSGSEQIKEIRNVAFQYATNRFETNYVRYAAGTTNSYKAVEHYRQYPWGWELIKTQVDPEGDNQVTSFEFYEDSGDPITYSQPWIVRYPDGHWEVRVYDHDGYIGALQYILEPFNDFPADPLDATPSNCEVTMYSPNSAVNNGTHMRVAHYHEVPWHPIYQDEIYNYESGDASIHAEGKTDFGFSGKILGSNLARANESLEKGLADHELFYQDHKGSVRSMYYLGGVFNSSTFTFTSNGTSVSAGPDWQSSTILWNGSYFPTSLTTYEVSTLEGQQVSWMASAFAGTGTLCPNKTTREKATYHRGNVVLKETAVFTGLDGSSEAVFETFSHLRYKNDSLGHLTNITWVDVNNSQVQRLLFAASFRDANGNDGELKKWEMNEQGVRTEYVYDSLKRTTQLRTIGITNALVTIPTVTVAMDYDASGRIIRQTTTSGGLGQTNAYAFDVSGRPLFVQAANGMTTNYVYSNGGRTVSMTLPNSGTLIREQFLDRRLKSLTGTAVIAEYHTNAVLFYPLPGSMDVVGLFDTIRWASPTSQRTAEMGCDLMQRQTFYRTPDFDDASYLVDASVYEYVLDKPKQTGKTGSPLKSYLFDFDGQISRTMQIGDSGDADLIRTVDTHRFYLKSNAHWFSVTTNWTYLADYSATPTFLNARIERLSGFSSSNIVADISNLDQDTNVTRSVSYLDFAKQTTTTVEDVASSTLNATNCYARDYLVYATTPTVAKPTFHYYDALGREVRVVDPLGNTATTAYNIYSQATNATDFKGATSLYEYWPNGTVGAGQLKTLTVNGRKTYLAYNLLGNLYRTWGEVRYPEERLYSSYGELVELRTFRAGSGWSGTVWPTNTTGSYDATLWVYQEHSGLLTNRTDAAGRNVSFTYAGGHMHTRTWGRSNGTERVETTYSYNAFGELTALDYNDGTPSVELSEYSRAGLPRHISDASGESDLVYDHANRLLSVAYGDGAFDGLVVSNRFHGIYGRDLLALEGTAVALQHKFGYDAFGRLASVSNGVYNATYAYKADSDLLQTTTCKSNAATILTTSRSWRAGNQLGSVQNLVDGGTLTLHDYTLDSLGRRTEAVLEDGSRWVYSYNDRDELTAARRFWLDGSLVAGQQFVYTYDNVGNRQTLQSGGDTNGFSLRTTSYTGNSLDQLTAITNPGYKEIFGVALFTNSVLVNNLAAERKVEYFRRELNVSNGSGPLWQDVTVASGGTTNRGGVIIPDDQQALTYDRDGNLSFDGTWTYEWDAENRLKSMTMTNVSGLANSNRFRLEFAYDRSGQRIGKIVKNWTGTAFGNAATNRFVYDRGNLLAIIKPDLSLVASFTWGQDLSGTVTGAGGVGGLVLARFHGGGDTNCFPAWDGNGNLTGLVDGRDKSVSARYEYDAYGQMLRATGPLCAVNPFRFSSKFTDRESGLVYFGGRYYNPETGTWLARDPSGENGGINLYLFANNSPINMFDPDGRKPTSLRQLAKAGVEASIADLYSTLSSFPFMDAFGQAAALMAIPLNDLFDGALFKNIGGTSGFIGAVAVGQGMGVLKTGGGGSMGSQSLGAAVVAGRMTAIAKVGGAALDVLRGVKPTDPTSSAGLAYSYLDNARKGNDQYTELDAILLGAQIGRDMIGEDNLMLNTGAFASALLRRDAAGAFSLLPEYNALNAWDMLTEIGPQLEGL